MSPQISEKTRRLLDASITADEGGEKLSRARKKIASRTPLVDDLMGMARTKVDILSKDTDNPILKGVSRAVEIPAEIALKGVQGVTTATSGLESGVSSFLLSHLEGKPERAGQEFIKGITGQQTARVSDLYRELGLNEFSSEAAGFMTAVAVSGISAKTVFKDTTKVIQRSLKRSAFRSAKRKLFGFRDMAKQWVTAIDDAMSNMRYNYNKVFKVIQENAIKNPDDVTDAGDVFARLPREIYNRLEKVRGLRGKVSISDGKQYLKDATVGTIKEVKDEISKAIPWGTDRMSEPMYRTLREDYFNLNKIIANNAGKMKPDLLRLNAKMKRLYDKADVIMPSLKTSSGKIKTNIRNVFNETDQDLLKNMRKFSSEYFKEGADILKTIDRVKKGSAASKTMLSVLDRLGPSALIGGAILGGTNMLRNSITSALSEDSIPTSTDPYR